MLLIKSNHLIGSAFSKTLCGNKECPNVSMRMNFSILCVCVCVCVCVCACVTAVLSELSVQINSGLTDTGRDRQLVNTLTQINSVSALCPSVAVSSPQEVMWANTPTQQTNSIWFNGIVHALHTHTQTHPHKQTHTQTEKQTHKNKVAALWFWRLCFPWGRTTHKRISISTNESADMDVNSWTVWHGEPTESWLTTFTRENDVCPDQLINAFVLHSVALISTFMHALKLARLRTNQFEGVTLKRGWTDLIPRFTSLSFVLSFSQTSCCVVHRLVIRVVKRTESRPIVCWV